jgi:hypothetical protein
MAPDLVGSLEGERCLKVGCGGGSGEHVAARTHDIGERPVRALGASDAKITPNTETSTSAVESGTGSRPAWAVAPTLSATTRMCALSGRRT